MSEDKVVHSVGYLVEDVLRGPLVVLHFQHNEIYHVSYLVFESSWSPILGYFKRIVRQRVTINNFPQQNTKKYLIVIRLLVILNEIMLSPCLHGPINLLSHHHSQVFSRIHDRHLRANITLEGLGEVSESVRTPLSYRGCTLYHVLHEGFQPAVSRRFVTGHNSVTCSREDEQFVELLHAGGQDLYT